VGPLRTRVSAGGSFGWTSVEISNPKPGSAGVPIVGVTKPDDWCHLQQLDLPAEKKETTMDTFDTPTGVPFASGHAYDQMLGHQAIQDANQWHSSPTDDWVVSTRAVGDATERLIPHSGMSTVMRIPVLATGFAMFVSWGIGYGGVDLSMIRMFYGIDALAYMARPGTSFRPEILLIIVYRVLVTLGCVAALLPRQRQNH
jgi:hypothetical protein